MVEFGMHSGFGIKTIWQIGSSLDVKEAIKTDT